MNIEEANAVLTKAYKAIEDGSISIEDIRDLRTALVETRDALGDTPIERAAKASARVLNTRLSHLSKRMRKDGIESFTPEMVKALPPSELRLTEKRFKRQKARARAAIERSDDETREAYETATFKCLSDHSSCLKGRKGSAKAWCHYALVICTVSQIVSIKVG